MTINAINGSVINQTRFPGAEAGLSLVELVGTVEVIGNISALTLRRLASATTSPTVSGTASTVKKSQLSISAAPTATTSATAIVRKLIDASGQAICVTTSGVGLAYKTTAASNATATSQVNNAYVAARNTISIVCQAVPSAPQGRTHVPRGAATLPTAVATAATLRKTPTTANAVATAAGAFALTLRNQIGATAIAEATATSSARFNVQRSATATPRAMVSAYARINLVFALNQQPAIANCAPIYANRGISFRATTQTNGYANVTIGIKYRLSASTIATAIAQSAASDFASAMPAPAERLMTVQASDRRMGVTE